MLCTLLSMATVKIKKHTHLALMALLSSVVFYLITNFGVWLTWDYYPKNNRWIDSMLYYGLTHFLKILCLAQ